MNLIQRPRRLRNGSVLRSMVRETRISADTLIYPMFVMEGTNIKEEIATMPGQYRWSIDRMDEILQELTDAGVKSVLLFGIPKKKDEIGSSAWAEDGIVQQAIRHSNFHNSMSSQMFVCVNTLHMDIAGFYVGILSTMTRH